ncbi:hypothetical protein [Rhodococcus triatomae]
MRLFTRAALVAAASIPLATISPALASAVDAGDVTYSYSVNGSTVSNTITNTTGSAIGCTTSLAPAPGGVLPPIATVVSQGQSLYSHGEIPAGGATQSITDVPDGSYVVLASCGNSSNTVMWVSAYPGLEDYLPLFQMDHAFVIEQESTVVTVPTPASAPSGALPGLGEYVGS